VPKSFPQKITNPNSKHIKAAHKILVKLTPWGCDFAFKTVYADFISKDNV
jgi:hypothetical protein